MGDGKTLVPTKKKNCPYNILDPIKSEKIAHHVIFFSLRGSRNYLANRCQAWKCYSGRLEQLTPCSLIGQLSLPPHEKAQTSLDIFPLEATQTCSDTLLNR